MKSKHLVTVGILSVAVLLGVLMVYDMKYFLVPTVILLGIAMMTSSNVALLLFCCAIPFEESLTVAGGGGSGLAVLGVCLVASYALHVAVGQRYSLPLALRASLWGVLFNVTLFIALGFSRNPTSSMGYFSTYLLLLLFFFIMAHSVNTVTKLRSLILAVMVAAIVAGVYTLLFSVDPSQLTAHQRLAGYAKNANRYGTIQVALGLLAAPLILKKFSSTLLKLVYAASVAFVIVSGLYSLSRGVLVSLFLTVVYGLFFLGSGYRKFFLTAVVVAAAVMLFSSEYTSRFESAVDEGSGEGSTMMRMAYLHDGLQLVLEYPIFGVGLGEFQEVFAQVNPDSRIEALVPHNMYLSLAVENGMFVFGCFMALAGTALVKSFRKLKANPSDRGEFNLLFLGIHLSLVFTLCEGWFATIEYSKLLWFVLALGSLPMGLARPMRRSETSGIARATVSFPQNWYAPKLKRPLSSGSTVKDEFHHLPRKNGEIVHIIGQLEKGGSEKQLFELSSALRKRGWKQTIVSLSPGGAWADTFRREGLTVVSLPRDPFRLRRFLALWQLLRRRRCLAHSWSTHTNAYTWLCMVLLRKPWIASVREDPLVSARTGERLRHVKYSYAYPRASCVITNSSHALASLQRDRVHTRRSLVVRNIVHARGCATPGEPAAIPVIIAVGSLLPRKSYHVLLEALSIVQRSGRSFRLLIAGKGPERQRLQQLTVDLSIAPSVTFLGQIDNVAEVMRSAHICAHPSVSEGMSNTILEAMAEGLPVIASAIDENLEILTHGVTGLCCPPNDPAALSAALNCLIDHPEERERLGRAGLAFVQEHMGADAVAMKVELLYDQLFDAAD